MREPRIIFWDLETLPDFKQVLKIYPRMSDYPGRTLKAQITSIISFGYRVFGEGKTNVISCWDFPEKWNADVNDDSEVVKKAIEILGDADAIVTANGKRFDEKVFNTRVLKHKLNPIAPRIPHIDLIKVAREKLSLFSNSLDNISFFLTGDRKIDNGGWELWEKVWYRDPDACKLMAEYCAKDVTLLEGDFKILRPFISNIPNYNLSTVGTEAVCPNCSSTRLNKRGFYSTKTRTYQRYVCIDCGSWSRTDANDKNARSL